MHKCENQSQVKKFSGKVKSISGVQKYVHVTNRREDGFIEFNFSVIEPSLFLEMILPEVAFNQFCEKNKVVFLNQQQVDEVEQEMVKWRYGEDTLLAR